MRYFRKILFKKRCSFLAQNCSSTDTLSSVGTDMNFSRSALRTGHILCSLSRFGWSEGSIRRESLKYKLLIVCSNWFTLKTVFYNITTDIWVPIYGKHAFGKCTIGIIMEIPIYFTNSFTVNDIRLCGFL